MCAKVKEEKVYITLRSSIQHPGQETESHALESMGTYIERNGATYLQYEEEQDGERIQSTIKIGDQEALIMRKGPLNMRLPFSIHQERVGEYRNEHLAMQLQVKTKGLTLIREGKAKGQFRVAYELYAEGSLLGSYELSITYVEGK